MGMFAYWMLVSDGLDDEGKEQLAKSMVIGAGVGVLIAVAVIAWLVLHG